jgi:hypothetical protein
METRVPATDSETSTTDMAAPAAQFSLAELFRLVTIVSVLFGCMPLTGVLSGALLVLMVLALRVRQGLIVIGLFLTALLAVNEIEPFRWPAELNLTLLVGIAVLAWHRWERYCQDCRQVRNTLKAKLRWQGEDCFLQ